MAVRACVSEGTATAAFCSWEIACSSRLHDRSYIIRLHFSFEFDTQKPDLNFNFQHDYRSIIGCRSAVSPLRVCWRCSENDKFIHFGIFEILEADLSYANLCVFFGLKDDRVSSHHRMLPPLYVQFNLRHGTENACSVQAPQNVSIEKRLNVSCLHCAWENEKSIAEADAAYASEWAQREVHLRWRSTTLIMLHNPFPINI